MDGVFIFLLFGIPITCLALMIAGFIKLFSRKDEVRKSGSRLLLTGSIIMAVILLIGFSLCSGIFRG
ncbi:hypothetical protein LQ567_25570 [Niabella pedocola]|uniref:DUF4190 domain-containing protein n=1 Tax=Niabella pedocola TaxID=1752077 RepID=A0ABS8PYM0_9BACT|nr:hypothetical protein [Niabella pedocola]MCD2426180.1 hypothetical protein [Niabella pedocola]